MMLGMMGKLLVNVIDKIKRHASIFIFFIGAYTIFIVGISHHRLETWLLYMADSSTKRNKDEIR